MKITKEWLKKQNACKPGYDWFIRQYDTDHELVIASLMKIDRFDWANWLIVRLMDKAQKVKYASYAARLVLPVYEKYKPGDDRPRKAIEAAESGDAACAAYAAAAYAADADAWRAKIREHLEKNWLPKFVPVRAQLNESLRDLLTELCEMGS